MRLCKHYSNHIFGLFQVFIETLAADDKYYLCYIWNLQVQYQMQLSEKLKTFPQFFAPFSKSSSEKKANVLSFQNV